MRADVTLRYCKSELKHGCLKSAERLLQAYLQLIPIMAKSHAYQNLSRDLRDGEKDVNRLSVEFAELRSDYFQYSSGRYFPGREN